MVLVWSSLGFVPILFFAKTEMRRLIAHVTCWQSGYIWLFALHLPPENFDLIIRLAITQGIFIAIISQAADSLNIHENSDSAKNIEGLFEKNYTLAVFLISSLALLTVMPAIFAFKRDASQLSNAFLFQIVGSIALPLIFTIKTHRLMKKSPDHAKPH
jgi:formate hydrogenlyase subunit 3/multisubunit Na+/H+ antiporter MnhD subunit